MKFAKMTRVLYAALVAADSELLIMGRKGSARG